MSKPDLEALIQAARKAYDAMTPEQKAEHDRLQRESWMRGEMSMGNDADEAAYRALMIEKAPEADKPLVTKLRAVIERQGLSMAAMKKELDQARRERDELRRWRPIETAPKDIFLEVCGPSGYTSTPIRIHVAQWVAPYKPDDWRTHAHDWFTDDGEPPTGWRQLSVPPSDLKKDEDR